MRIALGVLLVLALIQFTPALSNADFRSPSMGVPYDIHIVVANAHPDLGISGAAFDNHYWSEALEGVGVMSTVGAPQTGEAKTADCEGAEIILDQILAMTAVGWISDSGATKLGDNEGCPPAPGPGNEPPVAVKQITWRHLKRLQSTSRDFGGTP